MTRNAAHGRHQQAFLSGTVLGSSASHAVIQSRSLAALIFRARAPGPHRLELACARPDHPSRPTLFISRRALCGSPLAAYLSTHFVLACPFRGPNTSIDRTDDPSCTPSGERYACTHASPCVDGTMLLRRSLPFVFALHATTHSPSYQTPAVRKYKIHLYNTAGPHVWLVFSNRVMQCTGRSTRGPQSTVPVTNVRGRRSTTARPCTVLGRALGGPQMCAHARAHLRTRSRRSVCDSRAPRRCSLSMTAHSCAHGARSRGAFGTVPAYR